MLHVAAAQGLPNMISTLVLLDANIDAKTLVSLLCLCPYQLNTKCSLGIVIFQPFYVYNTQSVAQLETIKCACRRMETLLCTSAHQQAPGIVQHVWSAWKC